MGAIATFPDGPVPTRVGLFRRIKLATSAFATLQGLAQQLHEHPRVPALDSDDVDLYAQERGDGTVVRMRMRDGVHRAALTIHMDGGLAERAHVLAPDGHESEHPRLGVIAMLALPARELVVIATLAEALVALYWLAHQQEALRAGGSAT